MVETGFPTLRDANPPWHLAPGMAASAARSQNGAQLGLGTEATGRPKNAGSRWGFGSWGSVGHDEAKMRSSRGSQALRTLIPSGIWPQGRPYIQG